MTLCFSSQTVSNARAGQNKALRVLTPLKMRLRTLARRVVVLPVPESMRAFQAHACTLPRNVYVHRKRVDVPAPARMSSASSHAASAAACCWALSGLGGLAIRLARTVSSQPGEVADCPWSCPPAVTPSATACRARSEVMASVPGAWRSACCEMKVGSWRVTCVTLLKEGCGGASGGGPGS